MLDTKAIAEATASVVKELLKPLADRLDELDKQIADLPRPKEVDLDEVRALALSSAQEAVAEVKAQADAWQAPELPDVAPMIEQAVKDAVSAIPAPQDGKSVTLDDVAPLIKEAVGEAVSAIPAPRDGFDGNDGKDGRDGLDVKEMFRAEGGRLVAVMSDGTTRDLGVFVGKDGDPGRDGFNLEDFDATLKDDGRTVLLAFRRGEHVVERELGIQTMIYRGVFSEGKAYERGDTVTFGGSLWHCDEATESKPGEGQKSWTLAAKRGRDGKPGKDLMPPAPKQPIKLGGA